MPSVFEQNAVYLQSGDPTKEATPVNNYPGQLGARFSIQHPTGRATPAVPPRTKRFQYVRVDPAAAAVPKTGSPAYWADRANYLVTGVGGTALNQVAGVFGSVAPNKGDYCCIQQGGPCPVRASDANVTAFVAGDSVLGGATDLGVLLAMGTAPTTQPLGTVASPKVTDVTGGTGNQKILVDLNLPEVL
jgi:hypothetical protein